MSTKTKATITLMVLSPILAELLTNSTPITDLIKPGTILMLFFAYSLPIIILRELSVKWKTGLLGLFLMGFAYGILNEAILAKTILLQTGVPVPTFDSFGFYFGINFPWLVVVSSWHSLHSFIFPVMIVNYIYPEVMRKKWLGRKFILLASILVFIFSLLFYLYIPQKYSFIYFIVFYILILFLLIISKFSLKSKVLNSMSFDKKSILAGIKIASLIIVSFFLTQMLGIGIYFFYLALAALVISRLLKNNLSTTKITLLAIGSYSVFTLFSLISMISVGFLPGITTSVIFLLLFIFSAIKINKLNNN